MDFYSTRQSIYVAKGDDVLTQMESQDIAIIKIDVEGGELEVIEGLQQVLRNNMPFVFFEVLNHFLVVTGQQLDEETIEFRENRTRKLEEILRKLDYKIFNILPNNRIVEISEIKSKVSNDLKITDYVAIHSDFVSIFMENFKGTYVKLEQPETLSVVGEEQKKQSDNVY